MQVLRGIDEPLPGERPLEVVPPLAPYVRPEAEAAEVRRRLNLFPQRALTHVALTQEQSSRMEDAALLAQAVAPGVIDGLEVSLEVGRTSTLLFLGAGHAVTNDGHDLELAYPLRFDPYAVPVHGETLKEWTTAADSALRDRVADGETILLGELFDGSGDARVEKRPGLLPHAMVLVAQPVTVAIDRSGDALAACENATDETRTLDLAWEDGFRLIWVLWPHDRPLPLWSQDGLTMDSRFRNRLAYAVFDDERRPLEGEGVRSVRRMTETRSPDDPPPPRRRGEPPATPLQLQWPWESLGVALSIVGFDARFRPAFADRAAVVRQGGGPRNRAPLIRMAGDDVLWQARVTQMLEHLAELPEEDRRADKLVMHFERLPPAGLLPREAADFETRRQSFFPPNYDVQVQPVPIDMVDTLMAESSSLAAFNLSAPDQVQMLVPVPARFFERDLLNLDERIHPMFDLEIARLQEERLRLLRRRDALRRRFDLLTKAVTGRLPSYAEDDPNALPDERGALDAMAFSRLRRVEVVAGARSHWHGFSGAAARLTLSEADGLMVFVHFNAPVAMLGLRVQLPDGRQAGFYWGPRQQTGPELLVCAGELPVGDDGQLLVHQWVRLTAPVSLLNRNSSGQIIANPLAGQTIDNLQFGVLTAATGAGITWGYAGVVSNGQESYWVADAWPPGAHAAGETVIWDADASGVSMAENQSWGVSVAQNVYTFQVDELIALRDAFRVVPGGLVREFGESWPRPAWAGYEDGKLVDKRDAVTLASAQPPLIEQGLNRLIERVAQRAAAADDHVEVGFLRARTDIFRLRQGVLGTTLAGRLLTSPAAAELVQRSESAIATDKVFADYFTRVKAPKVQPDA